MTDNSVKIILVEDDSEYRNGIKQLLEDTNIEVIDEASDGIELFEKLNFCEPEIILLDLSMAGMDGNKTMNILSKRFANIKVIIMKF